MPNNFIYFKWNLPEIGVGFIRWKIGPLCWVNRGSIKDGYLVWGWTGYCWPRSRLVQKYYPGNWWKPWSHREAYYHTSQSRKD